MEHSIAGDELRAIKPYMASRTDALFISERGQPFTRQSVNYLIAEAAARAGLPPVHPHMLRHSCGFSLTNRGYDLRARKCHPEDPETAIEVRFVEVKGRAAVGEVALSSNEYKTAERLRKDYWLYVVFNCGSKPQLHVIQDPAQLGWEPLIMIEHYHLDAARIQQAASGGAKP